MLKYYTPIIEQRRDKKFPIICSTILYRLVLEMLYRCFLVTTYSYVGFTYSFSFGRYFLSWVVYLSLIPFLAKILKEISFSSTVMAGLFLISFTPSMILLGFCETLFWYWLCIYWTILFTANLILPKFRAKSDRAYVDDSVINALAYLFVFFLFFIWGYYAHFHVQSSIIDVYGLRAQSRNYNMPVAFFYLFESVKAVLPFLVIWNIAKKHYLNTALYSVAQIIAFFTDGSKSTIFLLFVSLIGYFLLKSNQKRIRNLPIYFLLLVVSSLCECIFLSTRFLLSVIIRRALFVPVYLNYLYYDFFCIHEPDFFRQSALRFLGFQSKYNISIPYLIGAQYFPSTSIAMSANNGLFSDAYANLDALGVFIMPIFIVVILRIFDFCSEGVPTVLLLAPIISVTIFLNSTSFFTNMLTHGFIAFFIILRLLPRKSVVHMDAAITLNNVVNAR